ncbi:hypothetical protein B0T22DRAFT_225361 [Podospora appendiculata]|uniref:Uncharacterized protein n=1 Tax=Podospora appendiculata TaxID=314037 RepID=A0AAE1CAK3_9PEZI|nr:hypothetical protein B0T22DRAFT_225361 [Podospora appendiculata]
MSGYCNRNRMADRCPQGYISHIGDSTDRSMHTTLRIGLVDVHMGCRQKTCHRSRDTMTDVTGAGGDSPHPGAQQRAGKYGGRDPCMSGALPEVVVSGLSLAGEIDIRHCDRTGGYPKVLQAWQLFVVTTKLQVTVTHSHRQNENAASPITYRHYPIHTGTHTALCFPLICVVPATVLDAPTPQASCQVSSYHLGRRGRVLS